MSIRISVFRLLLFFSALFVFTDVLALQVSPTSVTVNVGSTSSITVSNASSSLVTVISSKTFSGDRKLCSWQSHCERCCRLVPQPLRLKIASATVTVSVTVKSNRLCYHVQPGNYTLLAWNDLGMHCMDGMDFSVFTILPPYNTLHAQLKDKSGKLISTNVNLTYEAVADSTGSINTYSDPKTNFWTWVGPLFGFNPRTGSRGKSGWSSYGYTCSG